MKEECKWPLATLEYFRLEATERMAENDRVIDSQKARITELEFHLGKCRDSAYQAFYATAGVLPASYAPDEKPKKSKAKK